MAAREEDGQARERLIDVALVDARPVLRQTWACTASRIVHHDRAAQQFVVRPREGAACRTDLNLSQDDAVAKQLMHRYGPDGWVLHLEGRELVYRSFRHTGGCVYTASYRLEHRGRYHATLSSTHEGTGAGVDESTPHWHRTEFVPVHSAWELLETMNSSRALTPAERCSPWRRWVWPDAEGSKPWVAAGPCFGGTAFSGYDGMPWRVNLTQFVWRAYPGCEPSYLSGWRSLDNPERVEACLRSKLPPGQRTVAIFLGDSNMRGYYNASIAGMHMAQQGSMTVTSSSKAEAISALQADGARHVCTMKDNLLMKRNRSAGAAQENIGPLPASTPTGFLFMEAPRPQEVVSGVVPNRTIDYSCSKLSQCALRLHHQREASLHSYVEWGSSLSTPIGVCGHRSQPGRGAARRAHIRAVVPGV